MELDKKIIEKNLFNIEKNFTRLQDSKYKILIHKAALLIIKALKNKNKVMFCGNGGSAADSEHICTELVGRYLKNRKPYAAISLTTNTSLLSAISNDFSFNQIFSKQIQSLGKKNDILFAITTSGKSKNILNAIDVAKKHKIKIILLTSQKALNLKKKADILIPVPSSRVDRIQEMHIAVGHIICELVESCIN